jgi:hypothetical protein
VMVKPGAEVAILKVGLLTFMTGEVAEAAA